MEQKRSKPDFLSPEQRLHMPLDPAREKVPEIYQNKPKREPCTVADAAQLRREEVRKFGEDGSPLTGVFRPAWLEHLYTPRIVPRYARLRLKDVYVRSGIHGPMTLYRGELFSERDYPWCTIGKLFTGTAPDFGTERPWGSGVLVGPNLMLTAGHAIPWGVPGWFLRFVPAYRDGNEPFGHSYVSRVRGIREADDNSDYAICELATPLGRTCGWMGSQGTTDDDFYEDRGWDSVGYPLDFFGGERPCVEWNITPEDADVSDGEVEITFSSPFSSGGWSGGPLFGWVDGGPRVVGIMRGIQHNDYGIFGSDDDTVFTGGNLMVDLVKFGLANWPSP
ncbi:MAG: serine protease [Bryobacteraceae bacterium]